MAILGCRFSCDMLKAFWHNRPATVEQSEEEEEEEEEEDIIPASLAGCLTPH